MRATLTDRQLDMIAETGGMVGLNFAAAFLRRDGLMKGDVPLTVMLRHPGHPIGRLSCPADAKRRRLQAAGSALSRGGSPLYPSPAVQQDVPMPFAADAFRHHPGLAGKIRDPEQSFFRNLDLTEIDRIWAEAGMRDNPRYSDAHREAMRRETLAPLQGQDIWVFAYGSLMWDPAVYFAEVRRARLPGYRRSFCLVDRSGGRGTAEAPGLMAALDAGPACDGLVFRLAADTAERESEVIWRREMMAPCYRAVLAPVETAQGRVEALCFVADPEADMIDTGISHADQVRYLATGVGRLGTSREYLVNVIAGCRELRIEDPSLDALLAAVDAWPAPASPPPAPLPQG